MQVISGKYKGRKLEGFTIDGTRPTMNRIKESLFASIQSYIPNSTVLDLFAGSGALGIEALSNAAKECYFVDNNQVVMKILKKNTAKMTGVTIICQDYQKALKNFKGKKFNIIFLDPPYKFQLINHCLELIYEYDLLAPDGIVVCEFEQEEVKSDKYMEIKCKKYADKHIIVYKKVN